MRVTETEPYYIAHTAEHLTFDERYVGYGADKAEHFHRVMLRERELIVSPDFFVVHAHIGGLSAAHFADGSKGNWGTDANAQRWKDNNERMFKELPLTLSKHMEDIKWMEIFPPCVLDRPVQYSWALGPVAGKVCKREPYNPNRKKKHQLKCTYTCSASEASWGSCQPEPGHNMVCGEDDLTCESQAAAMVEGHHATRKIFPPGSTRAQIRKERKQLGDARAATFSSRHPTISVALAMVSLVAFAVALTLFHQHIVLNHSRKEYEYGRNRYL